MQLIASLKKTTSPLAIAFAVAMCLMLGCYSSGGPDLGYVEGNVTLDGKPLDDAKVQFEPDNARPSIAYTDGSGHYVLQFTGTRDGAAIGTHTVRIFSARGSSGGEGDGPLVKARPELLPASYNDKSTLVAEVKSGNNTFDFDLKSK
ncbi:hypothetical protein C5Y96_09730 [Blastopirellula marina]|uniref:Carboxypeptidase regulatory-like domain-containing protein n=1 Tax=Blastopirellula marina TaxID=124 RepID=A0A2S8FSZ5_9BACT|nr:MULTISPECIES: hypothetical protein [Pirellulaceae]PQO35303.1 hypothetical protein C5Y96_09730 [Blastopirellula marina]RCS53172.1 hypothetical protein DTL36_09740 [Bremerella cremea]